MVDLRGKDASEFYDAILKERNVTSDFFEYSDKSLTHMQNIEKAEAIVTDYKDKNVCILGDVDTDGATSCAIMYRFLKNDLGFSNVWWTINKGKAHGLKSQDLSRFDGADLLIIVDSLDSDTEQYSKFDIPIVIFDHHIPAVEDYGDNVTLVSSHYSENPDLSGAGVVWKFVHYYDTVHGTEYSKQYFDLATTGIVADMCNMRSPENRYICYNGFNNLVNPGLKAILAGYEFNSTSVSFSIATLINAAVRTFKNEKAVEILISDSNKEIADIIDSLKECKTSQNKEVQRVIPASNIVEENVICMILPDDMEYDVTGLIANKVSSEKQKPIIALRDDGDGWRGSMRGYDCEDFSQLCAEAGFAVFGHSNAAGVRIYKDRLESAIEKINASYRPAKDKVIECDVVVNEEDLTPELYAVVKNIDRVSGTGFSPIRFCVIIDDYTVGKCGDGKHLMIDTDDIKYLYWNWTGNFEDMEDCEMFSMPIKMYGTLDSGRWGRAWVNKFIISDYEVLTE